MSRLTDSLHNVLHRTVCAQFSMDSRSFCGDLGTVSSSETLNTLLNNECFISGLLLCLPFALTPIALLWEGIRVLCHYLVPGAYVKLQGDVEEETPINASKEDARPQLAFESSLFVQMPLQLRWILSFLLMGCGLVEVRILLHTTSCFPLSLLVCCLFLCLVSGRD